MTHISNTHKPKESRKARQLAERLDKIGADYRGATYSIDRLLSAARDGRCERTSLAASRDLRRILDRLDRDITKAESEARHYSMHGHQG